MNHCLHCNAEFDGRVCPACGTVYKICPVCRSPLREEFRYCYHCGYSGLPKPKSNDLLLNRIFVLLPMLYAVVFSLLLFALYAAPVATLLGESCGNVYQIMTGVFLPEKLRTAAIIMIAIAAVSVFCSMLYFCAHALRLEWARNFLTFVFLLVYAALIVACAYTIAQFGAGEERIASAGACPITILIFACAGVIQSFVALVGRSYILTRSPSVYGKA